MANTTSVTIIPQIETVSKKTFLQRIPFFQLAVLGSLVGFSVLTFFAKVNPYFPFDVVITRSIQSINLPFFGQLMEAVSSLGNVGLGAFMVGTIVLLAVILKQYKEAIMIGVSSIGVGYLSLLLKEFVSRPRPDPAIILQIGKYLKPDSFPSGHVLFAMGFYGFVLFLAYTKLKKGLLRKAIILGLILLIILMGVSRIYLGAHWFSDTLGSYLIGTVWLFIMDHIYKKLKVAKK